MSPRASIVAALGLALSLLVTAPAHADQLQAKDDPKVSDNLEPQGMKCATEKDTHDGDVVAVVKACQRFYTLDTEAETDEERDYGVFWLQSTINPKPGWCTTSGSSDIVFPSRIRLESRAPEAEEATKKSKRIKTTLSVDADGNASTPGSISQNSTLYPDKQTPSVKRREKSIKFRLQWTGSSDADLAFVSGIQVSWPADEGPPRRTRFGLRRYSLVEKETC